MERTLKPMEITITACRKGTWQGAVTCGGKTAAFSSELELLKAMEWFVGQASGEEGHLWSRSDSLPRNIRFG